VRRLRRRESGVRSQESGWLALALLAAAALTGCKRSAHDAQALIPEASGPLLSEVSVSDPAASAQLVRGFYGLEGGAWRWTAKQFEVALKPPAGAAENGAKLNFHLNVPDAILAKFGPVTLNAAINGVALAPETYSKTGNYVYARDVPAAALQSDAVVVQFSSDKGIAPSADDLRELALISVSIGLEPK
jgi:hypothetical protein